MSLIEERSTKEVLDWNRLYRIGGVLGIVAGILTVIDIMVFVISPQPSTIEGWFALFQRNWFVGLLDFDLLGMVAYALCFPMIVSLYLILRRSSQVLISVGTVFVFVGIAVYYASNSGLPFLSLSNQYAAATTELQRTSLMAAGQALLALFSMTAFGESFAMVSASLLMVSVAMLRNNVVFSKKTAYVGILANIAGLGELMPVPWVIMMTLGALDCIALGIWFIMIGRTLYTLGRVSNRAFQAT